MVLECRIWKVESPLLDCSCIDEFLLEVIHSPCQDNASVFRHEIIQHFHLMVRVFTAEHVINVKDKNINVLSVHCILQMYLQQSYCHHRTGRMYCRNETLLTCTLCVRIVCRLSRLVFSLLWLQASRTFQAR